MAWVRIDDQVPRNTKCLKAGPAACWLWVCAIAHCQSQLTEGFVSVEALPMIGVKGASRAEKLAQVLVGAGLFDRVDGGYLVHDYLEFNGTKDDALARKAKLSAARAEAGRLGGLAKVANAKQPVVANPSPLPSPPFPTVESPTDSLSELGECSAKTAGDFVRRYEALYAEHRRGAKLFRSRPSLDWDEAGRLLEQWPFDRLEKLAVIVLTTDDKWIAGTDRSFRIFALKATWADDKLKQWEAEHGVTV